MQKSSLKIPFTYFNGKKLYGAKRQDIALFHPQTAHGSSVVMQCSDLLNGYQTIHILWVVPVWKSKQAAYLDTSSRMIPHRNIGQCMTIKQFNVEIPSNHVKLPSCDAICNGLHMKVMRNALPFTVTTTNRVWLGFTIWETLLNRDWSKQYISEYKCHYGSDLVVIWRKYVFEVTLKDLLFICKRRTQNESHTLHKQPAKCIIASK